MKAKTKKETTKPLGTCDESEKVVARLAWVSDADAEILVKELARPHLADVLVWPGPESNGHRPILLAYYGDDRQHVMKRVADAETRFRSQGLRTELLAVRPADMEETRMFILAIEELETWTHLAEAGGVLASRRSPLPVAKNTRRRTPIAWALTLEEFVNDHHRRRDRVLLPEEFLEVPAANTQSEGAAVSADVGSGKKKACCRRKSERSEPQAANSLL